MNMKRLIVLTLVILLSALCFGGVCGAYAEENLAAPNKLPKEKRTRLKTPIMKPKRGMIFRNSLTVSSHISKTNTARITNYIIIG